MGSKVRDGTNLALASDARVVRVVLNTLMVARLTRIGRIAEGTQVEIVAVRTTVRFSLDRISAR